MKARIIVWTLAWDTRTGTDCRVFGSEHEFDAYIRDLVREDLSAVDDGEADKIHELLDAGDIWGAFDRWSEDFKNPMDTYNWDTQAVEVEISDVVSIGIRQ